MVELMAVTIRDVAKRAGVSITTVSRVLNATEGHVSQETKERVFKAVHELGYVPNILAASLKKHHSMTIGVVIGDVGNPFFARVIRGIEQTLRKSGYSVLITDTDYDTRNEDDLLSVLMERRVDGIIMVTAKRDLEKLRDMGIHVILISNTWPDANVDSIIADNLAGAYQATRHLVELGHRKIAVINGMDGRSSTYDRMAGYLCALQESGISAIPENVKYGDWKIGSGYEQAQALLGLDPRPTAIFVMNNMMTIGALRAIAEAGLKIPDDISLVGFDDEVWYDFLSPSLTSIRQPAYEMGYMAAEFLLRRLRRKRQPSPDTLCLPVELVIRQSTGPPPK